MSQVLTKNSVLADFLLHDELLSKEDVKVLRRECGSGGPSFLKSYLALGVMSPDELTSYLEEKLHMTRVGFEELRHRMEFDVIDDSLIKWLEVIPLKGGRKNTLIVAMADPTDKASLTQIEFFSGCNVKPVLATLGEIRKVIKGIWREFAPQENSIESLLKHRQSRAPDTVESTSHAAPEPIPPWQPRSSPDDTKNAVQSSIEPLSAEITPDAPSAATASGSPPADPFGDDPPFAGDIADLEIETSEPEPDHNESLATVESEEDLEELDPMAMFDGEDEDESESPSESAVEDDSAVDPEDEFGEVTDPFAALDMNDEEPTIPGDEFAALGPPESGEALEEGGFVDQATEETSEPDPWEDIPGMSEDVAESAESLFGELPEPVSFGDDDSEVDDAAIGGLDLTATEPDSEPDTADWDTEVAEIQNAAAVAEESSHTEPSASDLLAEEPFPEESFAEPGVVLNAASISSDETVDPLKDRNSRAAKGLGTLQHALMMAGLSSNPEKSRRLGMQALASLGAHEGLFIESHTNGELICHHWQGGDGPIEIQEHPAAASLEVPELAEEQWSEIEAKHLELYDDVRGIQSGSLRIVASWANDLTPAAEEPLKQLLAKLASQLE